MLSRAMLPTLVMLASPKEVAAKVVAPVTASVPAIAVLPDVSATVNLLVSSVRPPFSAVAPVTVRVPAVATLPEVSATVNLLVSIVRPPSSAVAPVTVSVPAVATLPLVSATVNLLLSIVRPPLRAVTPATVSVVAIVADSSTSRTSICAVPSIKRSLNSKVDPPKSMSLSVTGTITPSWIRNCSTATPPTSLYTLILLFDVSTTTLFFASTSAIRGT